MNPPEFSLGRLVITQNAARTIPLEVTEVALLRHSRRDWGLVDSSDWAANEAALLEGTRILSAYETTTGERFWIITEWDRSVTTILLPEDY